MQNSMPETHALLTSLGATFLKRLTHALLARDGHFSALLLSAIWGLSAGHTSLCVQGIFGSGKTYNSSLLVVILSTVLGLPTLISSEPNLPLATAADTICDLLQDAPSSTLQQYARCLAGSLTATTPIDYLAADRAQLFKDDSPLKCLILTVSRCVISANPTLPSLPLSLGFVSPSLMKGNREVKQASPPWPPTYLALASSSSLEIVNKRALALGGIPSRKLYSIALPKNLLVFSAAQALACQLKCFTPLLQLCEQTLP